MKISECLINNLLIEVDKLTFRLRNIKQSFKTTSNQRLRNRLINENKNIIDRINEIYRVSKLLNQNSNEKLNYSSLLIEKSRRTLDEIKTERNLFFL